MVGDDDDGDDTFDVPDTFDVAEMHPSNGPKMAPPATRVRRRSLSRRKSSPSPSSNRNGCNGRNGRNGSPSPSSNRKRGKKPWRRAEKHVP